MKQSRQKIVATGLICIGIYGVLDAFYAGTWHQSPGGLINSLLIIGVGLYIYRITARTRDGSHTQIKPE